MATALITGITGQDGAYLAQLLIEKGYTVIGTSRSIKPGSLYRLLYLGVNDQVEVRECSYGSQEEVNHLIEDIAPDEVYNLGAQSSVGYSFENPIGAFESNLLSVSFLLNAIRASAKSIKYYQASSSEMFGNINELPVKEHSYFHPSSPYGISKAAAHWLTVNCREGYDVFAVCGILFNHESCLRGANYVTKKIIRGAIEISQGNQDKLHLGNLSVTRDWGYAPKYVEAMYLMLQQKEPKDYLICSNSHITLKEFVEKAFAHLNLSYDTYVEIDQSLYRAVDLEQMWGNNSRAKDELGWSYDMEIDALISKLVEDELDFMEFEKKHSIS